MWYTATTTVDAPSYSVIATSKNIKNYSELVKLDYDKKERTYSINSIIEKEVCLEWNSYTDLELVACDKKDYDYRPYNFDVKVAGLSVTFSYKVKDEIEFSGGSAAYRILIYNEGETDKYNIINQYEATATGATVVITDPGTYTYGVRLTTGQFVWSGKTFTVSAATANPSNLKATSDDMQTYTFTWDEATGAAAYAIVVECDGIRFADTITATTVTHKFLYQSTYYTWIIYTLNSDNGVIGYAQADKSFTVKNNTEYDITDLVVKPGEGVLELSWKTEAPYATIRIEGKSTGGEYVYRFVATDKKTYKFTLPAGTYEVEVSPAENDIYNYGYAFLNGKSEYKEGVIVKAKKTGLDDAQNINQVAADQPVKFIKDGQIYILISGKVYNLLGAVVE